MNVRMNENERRGDTFPYQAKRRENRTVPPPDFCICGPFFIYQQKQRGEMDSCITRKVT